jgi:hypothetical protein
LLPYTTNFVTRNADLSCRALRDGSNAVLDDTVKLFLTLLDGACNEEVDRKHQAHTFIALYNEVI